MLIRPLKDPAQFFAARGYWHRFGGGCWIVHIGRFRRPVDAAGVLQSSKERSVYQAKYAIDCVAGSAPIVRKNLTDHPLDSHALFVFRICNRLHCLTMRTLKPLADIAFTL